MFGLVGKSLSHSISPLIHSSLGDPNYRVWETQDIESFIKTQDFSGLNVTIPYKETIIPYLDELDGIAKTIQSVNTVIKRDGKLIGYNTDYYGLFKTIQYHKISIKNKKVLIIGNGGASKTVALLMKNMNAQKIQIICRNPKKETEAPLTDIALFYDSNVIINTTPIGMYPHNDDELIFSLSNFNALETVLDLIYNPLRTKLMIEAESKGAKAYNGLYMLVMQAKASRELFLNDSNIDHSLPKKIYDTLNKTRHNLVFVGLPLCGKSAYAKMVAPIYQKPIIDTDTLIEMLENQPISDIFKDKGEPYFRQLENKVVTDLYQSNHIIISTGGGMIQDSDIMNKLKQNGIIIYLDKDYHQIMEKDIRNRPLINSKEDVERIALARIPLYEKYADILIKVDRPKNEVLSEIEAMLSDYFSR
jgi:shikimate dehydrogenase